RTRGARRRRDHVLGGGAASTEVLVGHVGETLVVRVGVDRRHEPFLDPERLVEDLRERRQTVRHARLVRAGAVPPTARLVADAHHGVVLEEVGEVVVVEEVVDRGDLDVVAVGQDPEDGPSDSAEAVDSDAYHFFSPPRSSSMKRSSRSTTRFAYPHPASYQE